MANALQQMPEFQAATAALNKHMTVAHEALSTFHGHGLLELSQLEQALATGRDDEGDKVRPKDVFEDVCAELRKHARKDAAHALRLLACYVVAEGGRLPEAERERLMGCLNPDPQAQKVLLALAQLVAAVGVPTRDDADAVSAKAEKLRQAKGKQDRKKRAVANLATFRAAMKMTFSTRKGTNQDLDDDDVADNRYAPPLKALLSALADDALDADLYPSLNGSQGAKKPAKAAAQSVRKNASKLASAKKQTKQYAGPKIVVVVLGGATYSELRAVYEVAKEKNREVILGATTVLTPDQFLAKLADSKK